MSLKLHRARSFESACCQWALFNLQNTTLLFNIKYYTEVHYPTIVIRDFWKYRWTDLFPKRGEILNYSLQFNELNLTTKYSVPEENMAYMQISNSHIIYLLTWMPRTRYNFLHQIKSKVDPQVFKRNACCSIVQNVFQSSWTKKQWLIQIYHGDLSTVT